MSEDQTEKAGRSRWLRVTGINVAILMLLLVLVEGLASLAIFGWMATKSDPNGTVLAQVAHTTFDPELGWVHQRDVRVENLYGPGRHLTTNDRGFRASGPVPDAEEPETARVICSGDSFTLGFGVGDESTWCELLRGSDPAFDPVNMGQAAYGVGQAFLWFERDAANLEHSIHVFTFITDDFRRLALDEFAGAAKPNFVLVDGQLAVDNTPLPPPSRGQPAWLRQLRSASERLALVEFSEALLGRMGGGGSGETIAPERLALFEAVLDSLVAINESKDSRLVLAYLPVEDDLAPRMPAATEAWLGVVKEKAAERDVPVVDVVGEFRSMSAHELGRPYIQRSDGGYLGSAGHLSEHGNRLVADHVRDALESIMTEDVQ